MGSDMPSGFGPPVQMGNNFSVSYHTESREQTDDLFAKISEGVHGPYAAGGHVLGVVFRLLHGQVRRQLAVRN